MMNQHALLPIPHVYIEGFIINLMFNHNRHIDLEINTCNCVCKKGSKQQLGALKSVVKLAIIKRLLVNAFNVKRPC